MIKLTAKNESKLSAEIRKVEGKAIERLLTLEQIKKELDYIQVKHLQISKKALEGTRVNVNVNAQQFPSAYKYTPVSTNFTATYAKGGWNIDNISRGTCNNKTALIALSETAKEAVIASKSKY